MADWVGPAALAGGVGALAGGLATYAIARAFHRLERTNAELRAIVTGRRVGQAAAIYSQDVDAALIGHLRAVATAPIPAASASTTLEDQQWPLSR